MHVIWIRRGVEHEVYYLTRSPEISWVLDLAWELENLEMCSDYVLTNVTAFSREVLHDTLRSLISVSLESFLRALYVTWVAFECLEMEILKGASNQDVVS